MELTENVAEISQYLTAAKKQIQFFDERVSIWVTFQEIELLEENSLFQPSSILLTLSSSSQFHHSHRS